MVSCTLEDGRLVQFNNRERVQAFCCDHGSWEAFRRIAIDLYAGDWIVVGDNELAKVDEVKTLKDGE